MIMLMMGTVIRIFLCFRAKMKGFSPWPGKVSIIRCF